MLSKEGELTSQGSKWKWSVVSTVGLSAGPERGDFPEALHGVD